MIERSEVEGRLATLTARLGETRSRRIEYAEAVTQLDTQIAQLEGAVTVLKALLAPAEAAPGAQNGDDPHEHDPPS